MKGYIWVASIVAVMSGCASPLGAGTMLCGKDYAELKVREIAIINQGTALENSVDDAAELTAEQRRLVDQAEALLDSRTRIADDQDVAIINRAREILRDESVWDRADDRKCNDGDTSFSLYCSLYFASRQIVGEYQHRRTALQEVRFALEDATLGRSYEHRLRDYNNDPSTRLQDIYNVLAASRARLEQRLEEQRRCKL